MEELTIDKKCKLIYAEDKKSGALLFYHSNKENQPSSKVSYWEYHKEFRKMTIDFDSQIYGEERIENYWEKILELDKDKKLNLDTLCDTIDNILFKDLNQFKE